MWQCACVNAFLHCSPKWICLLRIFLSIWPMYLGGLDRTEYTYSCLNEILACGKYILLYECRDLVVNKLINEL